MKINSKHRVLSIILSVLMALSLMPVAVFADDGTTSNYVTLELTFGEMLRLKMSKQLSPFIRT